MTYLSGHWGFDPFVLVVCAVVAVHENGLHNLARRSRPRPCPGPEGASLLFLAGLACY